MSDITRRLEHDGYAVVDLLSETEVAAARAVRDRFGVAPGDPRTGIFNDTWSTDHGYKSAVSAAFFEIFEEPARRALPGHRSLGWTSIVKWPGEDGGVPAHRDPTFVDEDRHRSLGVWCALDDLDGTSGTLRVEPGSHRVPSHVRAHQASTNLAPAHGPTIAVSLRPGEAIVYDHALVHESTPIDTGSPRVVVAGLLVPDEAEPRYALATGDDELTVIRIERDFFVDQRLDQLDVDAALRTYPHLETATSSAGRPAPRRRPWWRRQG